MDACVDWLATRGRILGSAAVVCPGLMIIIQSSKQVGQEKTFFSSVLSVAT
jgi:hypothetical protein